ncbi:PREDICTED: uncharacterized protein LOC108773530 [Cyphomyrmex costatus]|uniref:uncharacterized protein LOC108773530 n=1 Tax=Cyphomyrmex costatus TaxID=456900 RepID=UPI00085225A6|nr:PREDICTED: uncharacterized protein LOC108773530 [Cyphomyrmex costatus]
MWIASIAIVKDVVRLRSKELSSVHPSLHGSRKLAVSNYVLGTGGSEQAREREKRGTKRERIAKERTEDAGCRETVRRSNTRDRSGGECPLLLLGMLRCFSSPKKQRSISLPIIPR